MWTYFLINPLKGLITYKWLCHVGGWVKFYHSSAFRSLFLCCGRLQVKQAAGETNPIGFCSNLSSCVLHSQERIARARKWWKEKKKKKADAKILIWSFVSRPNSPFIGFFIFPNSAVSLDAHQATTETPLNDLRWFISFVQTLYFAILTYNIRRITMILLV